MSIDIAILPDQNAVVHVAVCGYAVYLNTVNFPEIPLFLPCPRDEVALVDAERGHHAKQPEDQQHQGRAQADPSYRGTPVYLHQEHACDNAYGDRQTDHEPREGGTRRRTKPRKRRHVGPVAAKTTMKITAAQLRARIARIVAFANLASPTTLHLHGRPASRAAAAHEGWSGRRDLNPRPCGPKPHALARLRYAPIHRVQAGATPRPARQAATRCRGVAPAYIGFDILYSACTSAFQALRHPTCPTRRHPTLTTGG